MKKTIIFFILVIAFLGMVISQQEPLIYYSLNLEHNRTNILLKSIEIEFFNEEIKNSGNYSVILIDRNNKEIKKLFFDVPNLILYDRVNENGNIIDGGLLELNQTGFKLYVPYYENAQEIVIYDKEGKELEKIDVSIYAKDKEKILDEKKNPIIPDFKEDEEKKNKIIYVIITSILILIGLLLIIYYLKKVAIKNGNLYN